MKDFILCSSKTVLNNINILDNNESFKIINNHFIQLVNQAYLLDDNAIIKICQDLFYLISQGVAAFYPYIWILLKNHGHITTYTDKKLRTINHYAVVFSFDGYNAKSIREILKSNCILCSEQALSAFKTVKTKERTSIFTMCKKHCYISWFKLLRNNSRTMINLTNTYLIFQISIAKNFVAIHYQEIPKGCMLICIVFLRMAVTSKFMACNC